MGDLVLNDIVDTYRSIRKAIPGTTENATAALVMAYEVQKLRLLLEEDLELDPDVERPFGLLSDH